MADVQGNTLTNLPLRDLFGTPFLAAAKAQRNMAIAAADFVKKYGMDSSGNIYMNTLTTYFDIPIGSVSDVSYGYLQDASGSGIFFPPDYPGLWSNADDGTPGQPSGSNVVIGDNLYQRFQGNYPNLKVSKLFGEDDKQTKAGVAKGYKKRIGNRIYILDENGKVVFVQGMRSISVPFISMLNIPSLCIDVVNVDFTIKISTQTTTASTNTFQNTLQENQGSIAFYDKGYDYNSTQTTAVSTSTARTSTDDSTESTYTVSMKAKQMDPPGLIAVMNFITNNKDTSSRKFLNSSGQIANDPTTMKS
jgi:hypothetical protein